MKTSRQILILLALFVVLMSIPWLVPHAGLVALVALVPLLCAERIATMAGMKRFWIWHYGAFVVWNALTTWWVCEATVGGGLFAVFANALQMSLVFGLFRLSRKSLQGVLPYIFLAALWVAWERFYCTWAEISWPWLVLGNAFARTTSLIQWYEYVGHLGGSLWIWAVNLGLFGLMVSLSEGSWERWNGKGRAAAALSLASLIIVPVAASLVIYNTYEERSDKGQLEVVMAQSSFNPYQKRTELPQSAQNAQALDLFRGALKDREAGLEYPSEPVLLLVPETFTSDIVLNDIPAFGQTWKDFQSFIADYPDANMLFGASTYELFFQRSAPSILARPYGEGWIESHNSAIMTDATGRADVYHKSKLVVGTELTPYPKLFVPIENWLCKLLGVQGLMGHSIGQDRQTPLLVKSRTENGEVRAEIPLAPVICYESIYGEYCTEYVRNGAQAIAVMTNDGWWGDTPGYRQHFSYSRLRAIELRRDVARCANTGITAFIDQKGDVLMQSTWWQPEALRGKISLSDRKTFFAEHGDIAGRICLLVSALLMLFCVVNLFAGLRRG